jgi:hypothetical protein
MNREEQKYCDVWFDIPRHVGPELSLGRKRSEKYEWRAQSAFLCLESQPSSDCCKYDCR